MPTTLALDFGGVMRTTSVLVQQFFQRDQPRRQAVYGPLLLVGGGDDILFTDIASRKAFQRLCNAGARVQRNVYPGLGHDPVVYGSLRDQLSWIAARFAGEPAPGNCAAPEAMGQTPE